jgi:hypothetical protein
MNLITCETCGATFLASPSAKARYCGRACYGASRRNNQVSRPRPDLTAKPSRPPKQEARVKPSRPPASMPAKIRARENAGRIAVLAPGSFPRTVHTTRAGARVTLRAVVLPEVTQAEIRFAVAAWSGYERGLRSPKKKKPAGARAACRRVV